NLRGTRSLVSAAMAPRDPRRAAWRVLVETLPGLLDRLDAELQARHYLPLAWYDVLLHLDEAPGGRLRMDQLAQVIALSPGGLAKRTHAREQATLGTRRPAPPGRPAVEIELTERGRTLTSEAAATHVRGIEHHFTRHLQPADGEALLDVLGRIPAARESLA